MRQAGRALPEYRALKQKYSFLELVQSPDLAAEVTLQPIRRFNFDAAILFSDILTLVEGLGQPYRFRDEGGIEMDFLIKTQSDIDRLDVSAVCDRLRYTSDTLSRVRNELGTQTALIGFTGSPWTLANYMLEGGGAREFLKAKEWYYSQPKLFDALMNKLTQGAIRFLGLQIEAGVDAVQVFDSLGGLLANGSFEAASGQWIKQIVAGLKKRVPVIVFSRGTHGSWDVLAKTGADVLGVDWNVNLGEVSEQIPSRIAVQGNLDPFVLTTTPQVVRQETRRILREMRHRPGHIFNLGHGVPPSARIENIEALVAAVRSFK